MFATVLALLLTAGPAADIPPRYLVQAEGVTTLVKSSAAYGTDVDAFIDMQAAVEAASALLCEDACLATASTLTAAREPIVSTCEWYVVRDGQGWAATLVDDGGPRCVFE